MMESQQTENSTTRTNRSSTIGTIGQTKGENNSSSTSSIPRDGGGSRRPIRQVTVILILAACVILFNLSTSSHVTEQMQVYFSPSFASSNSSSLSSLSSFFSQDSSSQQPKPRSSSIIINNYARKEEMVDVVVAYCKEDLSWLDGFGQCGDVATSSAEGVNEQSRRRRRNRIRHVHIYSKCGHSDLIYKFTKISNCVTVHKIENCATQEFAYFTHVVEQYDHLADLTAFVQGGSVSENPHILHDITSNIPGTTYRDLSRHVRMVWAFGQLKNDSVQNHLYRLGAPHVMEKATWLIGWRSMFIASRSALHRHSIPTYEEFNFHFCKKGNETCVFINCNMEAWWGPMFDCVPYLFDKPHCRTHELRHTAPPGIPEDFRKDSKVGPAELAKHSKMITCDEEDERMYHNLTTAPSETNLTGVRSRARSIIFTTSNFNGAMACVDHEVLLQRESPPDLLSMSSSSAVAVAGSSEAAAGALLKNSSYWETQMNITFDEDDEEGKAMKPNLTNVKWNQPSQWAQHEAFSKQVKEERDN